MSITFSDNGEQWIIWQFEDKGEKIQLATKNLSANSNTPSYFFIQFSKDNFYNLGEDREKKLSKKFGIENNVFEIIQKEPKIGIKNGLNDSELITIKNFIIKNNFNDSILESTNNELPVWAIILISIGSVIFVFVVAFFMYKKKIKLPTVKQLTEAKKEKMEQNIHYEKLVSDKEKKTEIINKLEKIIKNNNDYDLKKVFDDFFLIDYNNFDLSKLRKEIIDILITKYKKIESYRTLKEICSSTLPGSNQHPYCNKVNEIINNKTIDYIEEKLGQQQPPQTVVVGGFSLKKRSGIKHIFLLFGILLLGVLNITKIVKSFLV